jgi:Mrp family chromosome partitioning ATPase
MSVYRDALKKVDQRADSPQPENSGRPVLLDAGDESIDREFIGLVDHVIQNNHGLVGFTTAHSGDGATYVSHNFARNLAKHFGVFDSASSQNRQVLLVDFTLTDPQRDGLSTDRTLAAYFQNPGQSLSQFVVPNRIEGVDYLPVGRGPNGPLDLVASILRYRVETRMFGPWDYVVFDCPPVHSHYETYVLSRQLSAIYLVIQHAATKAELALKAAEILQGSGNFAGVVMNGRRHRIPDWLYRRLQAR